MPVFLNAKYPGPERRGGLNWPRVPQASLNLPRSEFLHIGLINNIGDGAMSATEYQFLSLLQAAAGDMLIHATLFNLPEVERKSAGIRRVGSFYWNIDHLWEQSPQVSPDGMIVTGREPLSSDLRNEAYWSRLQRVLAWTREHSRSAVWSCLAAHAAVLALDGIERVRSPHKHFGILTCEHAELHPLLTGVPPILRVPHSRWNGISAGALVANGYQLLTLANDGVVDTFVKQDAGLHVFFQGHPEYETETLMGEYRRDVGRYLKGEMENYPLLPRDYFDAQTEQALLETEARARTSQPDQPEKILKDVSAVLDGVQIHNTWRSSAILIYRNWLKHLWAQKSRTSEAWQTSTPSSSVPCVPVPLHSS